MNKKQQYEEYSSNEPYVDYRVLLAGREPVPDFVLLPRPVPANQLRGGFLNVPSGA